MRPKHPLFDIIVVVAVFLASTFLAAVCGASVRVFAPLLPHEKLSIIIYSVQFVTAIAGVGAYYFYFCKKPLRLALGLDWRGAPLALWGVVLTFAASVVLEPLLSLFPAVYFERIGSAVGHGFWAILLAVVFAPVFEELLFRGLVLEQARRSMGAWRSVLLTGAIFALVHLPNWPQVVNAFVMGVLLGYIYLVSRSLWPVVGVHVINNAIAYLMLETTGEQGDGGVRELLGNDTIYWSIFGASAVVLAASLVLMGIMSEKINDEKE